MTDHDVLVTTKQTAFDHDLENHSYEELIDRYDADQLYNICRSHERHYDTLADVERQLDAADVAYDTVATERLDAGDFQGRDRVISVGGDGTVLATARYVRDDTPVLPLRSDGYSRGGLTTYGFDKIEEAVDTVLQDEPPLTEWTRLVGEHDGQKDIALNDVAIREPAKDSADYTVMADGEEERQQATGFLVTAGAGSSGWYSNVNGGRKPFPAETEALKYIAREPMDDSGTYLAPVETVVQRSETLQSLLDYDAYNRGEGWIEDDEEIRIRSEMNDDKEPVIQFDGDRDDRQYRFPRGDELTVRVADQPLHVVDTPETGSTFKLL